MQLPQHLSGNYLQNHLSTTEMRQQLLNQTIKDFGVEPWQVNTESEDFFNLLEKEIYYTLQAIVECQPQLLPNIIYRIDLNEKRVRELLNNPDQDAIGGLTKMVLEREMKKVFYKNVYSGKIKI